MSQLHTALLLCATIVGLTLWILSGEAEAPEPQELKRTATTHVPTDTGPETQVVMEREDARGFEPGSLRVMTKNPDGVQLADAVVTLTREDERAILTGGGVHRFGTLAPGAWIVLIEHPDFIEHIETVQIAPGADESLNIRLYPDLLITGTIHDRFGRKQVGQYIWFLKAGEQYPGRMRRAQKMFGGQVQPSGAFEAHIPADVPLRMVVGLPGKPRWEDRAPITLHAGDPQHLDLVISGTTLTKVVVHGANLDSAKRKSMFSIAIQASKKVKPGRDNTEFMLAYDIQARRQKALTEQAEKRKAARAEREREAAESGQAIPERNQDLDTSDGPRGGRLKKKRQERLIKRRERIAAGLPPAEVETTAPVAPIEPPVSSFGGGDGLAWRTLRSEICPVTGELSFHHLPLNQDLRLRVDRRVESLNSEVIFRAQPDVIMVLDFTMPAPQSERPAGAAPPTLFLATRANNLPSDAPKAGATWSHKD